MKTIYNIHGLQLSRTNPLLHGTWRGRTFQSISFGTVEEAEFYCEKNSTLGLIFWWEPSEMGRFTEAYMRDYPSKKRKKDISQSQRRPLKGSPGGKK